MALTTEQESRYDQTGTVVQAYTYMHVPTLIYSATITAFNKRAGAYVSIDVNPATAYGSLEAVREEMTCYVGINGTYDGGSQRVRDIDYDNNRILIGRASVGRNEGQITPQIGATLYIYDDYRPFIKAPYIAVEDETPIQYKDEALFESHEKAQPPVAVAGYDRLIITNDTSASLLLSSEQSYAVRQGATIAAVKWDIRDGTITSGTDTDEEIEVSFPRGARWISLRVTDTNGINHRTFRLIVVAQPQDCIPSRINSLTHDPYGNTLNITIDAIDLPIGLPPRAKVLVSERENYDATLFPYAERFSGWLADETSSLTDAARKYHTLSFTVEDAAAFMKRNVIFPQSVNVAEELGGWFTMADADIDRMIHHILHWHTNLLSVCRFKRSGEGATYPFPAMTTSGGSAWETVERLARAFAHELTVSAFSEIKIVRDPHVLPSVDQAVEYSLPVHRKTGIWMTFTRQRYSTYSLQAEKSPQSYWLQAMGIVATNDLENVSVVGAVAPSNAPNFGTGEERRTDFLVTSQAELNVWAANLYAAGSGASLGELQLTAINPVMVIDVSNRDYVAVELPTHIADRYHLGQRWTVERVEYSYDRGRKTATYVLRPEIIAEAPAKRVKQIEDGDLVQAWDNFDNVVLTPTGDVVTGYEGMGLTQAELEESLSKTRLKVYLSEFETDEQGNSGDGGDTDDPDVTDYEEYSEEQSKISGGYYNIVRRMHEFWQRVSTYYTSIASDPNKQALLKSYIMLYIADSASVEAEIDAWVDYIINTDAVMPTIPAANRVGVNSVTAFMYCEGGARTGLVLWSYTQAATPRARLLAAIPAISETQFERWYNDGRAVPQDIWSSYYCYRYPPETFQLNLTYLQNTSLTAQVNGVLARVNYTSSDGRLFRIQASGKYVTAAYTYDAFYRLDNVLGTVTYAPIAMRLLNENQSGDAKWTSGVPIGLQEQPAYKPSGVYDVIAQTTGAAVSSTTYIAIRDARDKPRTVTSGSISLTIYDMGNR